MPLCMLIEFFFKKRMLHTFKFLDYSDSNLRFCVRQTIEYGELLSFCNSLQTNRSNFSKNLIEIVCLKQFSQHLFLSTAFEEQWK